MKPELAIAVPIVLGVVEAIKTGWKGSARFAPLMALILGVFCSLGVEMSVIGHTWPTMAKAVLDGLVVGLGASGLWSGVKHVKTLGKTAATVQ